jgi:hypothetical protein
MKSPVLPFAWTVLAGLSVAWPGPGIAAAAPLIRDLGQGLLYYRVHHLPADLPASGPGPGAACILDLRFADGDNAAPAALAAWIGFNATPRTPVLVLANPATSPALLRPLARVEDGGLIVIGPAEPGFHPDIAVSASPAGDRKAYEALEQGTPLAGLLSDNPDKPRMDEAELAREHLPDSAVADAGTDRKPEPAAAPAPVVDRVLQRAVQIHRGLLALKQVP